MEYAATAQAANAQLSVKPSPELGRLKAASERVARAANNVENFLARFHGPMPESALSGSDPTADNYRNDLESLFRTLDRLESAVSSLDHIG